jgi:anti-sigma factor RsiW
MNRPELVTEGDLSAYVDGELPVERQAEVAAWLAANPDAAVQVATYRAQKRELREALEPILREPVPPQLLAAARPRPLNRWIWRGAAAVLLLAVGASGGWYAGTSAVPPPPVVE